MIEVIISMALIAIISISVYNTYLLLIRQTKDGQVKQTAALEGKKVIEQIKAATKNGSLNVSGSTLNIGDLELEEPVGSTSYNRYLDENYNECSKEASKYIETVTLNKTQATINGNSIDVNSAGGIGNTGSSTNVVETFDYNIFIKNDNGDIEIGSEEDGNKNSVKIESDENIKLFVYTSWDNSKKQKEIIIKDSNGKELIGKTFKNIDDSDDQKKQIKLTINFKGYTLKNDLSDELKNIQINLYNNDIETLNICLEKSNDLDVDVEDRQGEVNFYNNRAEDGTKIGKLHDIKVEIRYTNGENLFTGYSNENVDIASN